jgi:hypothetical protein
MTSAVSRAREPSAPARPTLGCFPLPHQVIAPPTSTAYHSPIPRPPTSCHPPEPWPGTHLTSPTSQRLLLLSSEPLPKALCVNSEAEGALTQCVWGGVGCGLRGQDDQLCGGVLGQGEH